MISSITIDAVHRNALLTAGAIAVACAILSVIVVLRRWAFIGEGIGHSGFGGAGTAWLAALVFPAINQPWAPYAAVVIFCLLTALAVGYLARGNRVNADAAIGIFLVASLAWGFVARHVYLKVRNADPTGFQELLFGQMQALSTQYTAAAMMICLAVIVTSAALWKEILAYSFDPQIAQTSGVRSTLIHYLLIVLIAILIILGVRVAGSVLVTALLILPGATALTLARTMPAVIAASVGVALVGAAGGLILASVWDYIPAGPAIVLVMFVEFVIAYALGQLRARAT